MKKSLLFALALFSIFSCKKKEDIETRLPEETMPVVLGTDCYAFDDNNSSISLRITEIANNQVKGYLKYDLSGKDQNNGTFEGILQNDTLIAVYTFQSEGIKSKRDVAFLVKENQLVEGYGEMSPDGTAFKNRKAIAFTNTMALAKIECKGTPDCPSDFGFVFSELKKECLPVQKISTALHLIKSGTASEGDRTYVVFSEDNSKAEVFLPNAPKGMVLDKTSEGNWGVADYKLTAWKGYVLQYKGNPVFAGE
jgi:hypothetical protein